MKTVWLSVGTALLFISQAAVAGQHSQRIQQNGITQHPAIPAIPAIANITTVTNFRKSCTATEKQPSTIRLQRRDSYARVVYRPCTGPARQPDRDDCHANLGCCR